MESRGVSGPRSEDQRTWWELEDRISKLRVWSSWLWRSPHTREVVGSNPTTRSILPFAQFDYFFLLIFKMKNTRAVKNSPMARQKENMASFERKGTVDSNGGKSTFAKK